MTDADIQSAIAAATADTADLQSKMDEMLAMQARMQGVMITMLQSAMTPEVIGALAASAQQLETAFAEASVAADPVQ